jgi:hypothetical protein
MRRFMVLVGVLIPAAAMAGDRQEAAAKVYQGLKDAQIYTLSEFDPMGEGKGLRGRMIQPPNGWQIVIMDRKVGVSNIPRTDSLRSSSPCRLTWATKATWPRSWRSSV